MTTARKRPVPLKRRDATGHLTPKYAADLRKRTLEHAHPDGVAFLGQAKSKDPLAEVLGEDYVAAATTGGDVGLETRNQGLPEDEGGPFVVTRARDEFARGPDASNPKGATREPFPTARSGEEAALSQEEDEEESA